MVPAASRKV